MIELLPEPPPEPPRVPGGRGLTVAVTAAVLVLVLVALINGYRNRDSAALLGPLELSQPVHPPPPGITTPPDGRGERLPVVACPQIRDEQSRLAYRCIDNALRQDESDTYLGLRISLNLEVEPGWVISEGSGNPESLASSPSNDVVGFRQGPRPLGPGAPSPAQVRDEVRRRTGLALERGYGDNPSSRTMTEHVRSFAGVQGYELVTEITINPAYRARRHLAARTERLWTVGLPTTAGVSIFMLSIPDNRSDLWSKADATVATVHVF
ncbi:MAG TPA: hypothetical protein VGX49_02090 [Jatrophihabitans sp.]|nr:hypothetical protein [Jatrophihabitans sp.]